MKQSLATVRLCELLPAGPDRTEKFDATLAAFCSAPEGVSIRAEGKLTCSSSSGALIQMSQNGRVDVELTVDIGACKTIDSRVSIDGDVGTVLSGLPQVQDLARSCPGTALAFVWSSMSERF
ncbi:hypothetical protein [Rhizobium sp. RAF56]|uniref:hypothetical protein n=1 Tax=Rhizobium sp. RAF56 TaxID=3233062 RepID=UPI003F973F6B